MTLRSGIPRDIYEEHIHLAYLLGMKRANLTYDESKGFGVIQVIEAVRDRDAWDKAVETREDRLERQLADERRRLRDLRGTVHKPLVDFASTFEWMWADA